jgi:hypothetical protein
MYKYQVLVPIIVIQESMTSSDDMILVDKEKTPLRVFEGAANAALQEIN